jgi:hypothetical protein
VQVRGRQVSGYWSSASNRIVLAGDAHLIGPVVRHEMAHALTRSTRHSRELFLERCGGVLHCGSECLLEAGDAGGPDPRAVRVEPDFLQVSAALTPADPSLPGGDGFLIMTVTARNPAAHPIVVSLRAGQRAFFYELKGAGENRLGGPAPSDPAITWFEPGETKRHLFDFRIPPDAGPGAWKGEYIFRGGYGTTYVDVSVTFD